MLRLKSFTLAAIAAACSFVGVAQAQSVITWSESVDLIAGGFGDDSFVSQNGTFVNGFYGETVAGATNVVIGDSSFSPAAFGDLNTGVTANDVTLSGNFTASFDGFGAGRLTDPDVAVLVSGSPFDGSGSTEAGALATFTIDGLTIGNDYEIQIVTNDARGGTGGGIRDSNWQVGFTDGVNDTIAGISQIVNRAVDDATDPNNEGDFIIGTFTAVGATQTFDFGATRGGFTLDDPLTNPNNGQAQFNAFQIRDITPSVVPEPSSLALLGMAGLGLVTRRRRK